MKIQSILQSQYRIILIISAFVIIGFITYSNTLNAPFVFDDDEGVEDFRLRYPYFTPEKPIKLKANSSYAEREAKLKPMVLYQWNHSISTLINSLIDAGLRIDFFNEFPFTTWRALPFLKKQEDGGWILPSHQESMPMQEGIIYEDYLTLFYNFRYGHYGPLEQGRTYNLPLRIHKEMNSLELSIASQEEEERHRQKESNKSGKHFFLRFRVIGKDVSSHSGEIEGWLSRNGVPTKGTIKDVTLFGDLWGELIQRNVELPPGRWRGNSDGCI